MIKSHLRAALTMPRLAAHCAYGMVVSTLALVDNDKHWPRERLAQHWHRQLLDILRVKVSVNGQPATGARIIVANHVSWIDIPLVASLELTRFVSKAEVKTWPIAGTYADGSGTFYLQRGAGATKHLVAELKHFVQRGGLFTFFPEGTTGTGETVMRFQPRLFAVAVDTGCPVQPIAIRYAVNEQGENFAPYVGDDDLLTHLYRVLCQREVRVQVDYLAPIDASGKDRNQLALAAQRAVEAIVCPDRMTPVRGEAKGGETPEAGSEDALVAA